MAPSIRVTQDVYNGLRAMIEEQGYAKTPNGVIDRLLRGEGVMPSEPSVAQNIVFQQVGKNKAETTTASSFSETEVKEFRTFVGEPIPNYRFRGTLLHSDHPSKTHYKNLNKTGLLEQ